MSARLDRAALEKVGLPEPAARLIREGDEKALADELGDNYARYHDHLKRAAEGLMQKHGGVAGDIVGRLAESRAALEAFQVQAARVQEIGDAERALRLALGGKRGDRGDVMLHGAPVYDVDGGLLDADRALEMHSHAMQHAAEIAARTPSESPIAAVNEMLS